MSVQELYSSNMKANLVDVIKGINLEKCNTSELIELRAWASSVREMADHLTLESEVVGHVYSNLEALSPRVAAEATRRGLVLVK